MRTTLLTNLAILLATATALAAPAVTASGSVAREATGRAFSTEATGRAFASEATGFDRAVATFGAFSALDNACVREIWPVIPPRDAPADRMVARLVEAHLREYGPGLIILDSGHAHSVAAAVRLAELGYAVEFKMENDRDFLNSLQTAAAVKHLTERLAAAKASSTYGSRGEVIALDTHRKRDFTKQEFPSPAKIKAKYQGHVIWVTEGSYNEDRVITHSQSSRELLETSLSRSGPTGAKNEWLLQYINDPQIEVKQHLASPYFGNLPQQSASIPFDVPSPACEKWVGWNLRFLK